MVSFNGGDMFVRQSKYDRLEVKYYGVLRNYDSLLSQWNSLIAEINKKGGRDFLDSNLKSQFSKEDIDKLILLCHPDKHNGKRLAVDLTSKLLKLREEG